MKIAVIGIGGTGSAALRFLAQSGHEATGYEQFEVGHSFGSSHGHSRIIRYTYPDNLYTAMMADAYPLWASLEQESETNLFERCGGVYFGPRDDVRVQSTEAALIENGLPYEKLDATATRERAPALRLLPNEIALFQSESGFLRSTQCVLANARLALTHGATLHENIVVRHIEACGAQVLVRTEDSEEVFDRVIVTAGAWMQGLFADLHLPLRVTRQEIVYLHIAQHPKYFEPGMLPVWIDAGAGYYGFPNDGQIEGVKFAAHTLGEETEPATARRERDETVIQRAVAYAAMRLPDLSSTVTHSQVCLYTNTPDEDFIIDRAPDAPNVWLVSGCSGHGFKFTALLGHIAATLATDGSYGRDLSRFSLARFH